MSLSNKTTASSGETESIDSADQSEPEQSLSFEEKFVQWAVIVLVPFLITFIAFGVIILAYSQWKIY